MITIAHDILRRPKGIVRLWEEMPSPGARRRLDFGRASQTPPPPVPGQGEAFKRKPGKLLFEADNLYVNAGLPVLANLLAAGTAGYVAAAVGFGSGNTPPTVGDADLSLAPKYYNAVGSHVIGPSGGVPSGSVLFNYGLLTTDYAAAGITIQELGLFANSAAQALPVMYGGSIAWAASHAYSVGNIILDSNFNLQRCTTAGTSGGSAPSWAITIGNTTTDNTVTWTLTAMGHFPPTPMIAHVVVPAFPYAGAANYSGTWTISM